MSCHLACMLAGVRERVLCLGIAGLFHRAKQAAASVPPPSDASAGGNETASKEQHLAAKRAAAQRVLAEGMEMFKEPQRMSTA